VITRTHAEQALRRLSDRLRERRGPTTGYHVDPLDDAFSPRYFRAVHSLGALPSKLFLDRSVVPAMEVRSMFERGRDHRRVPNAGELLSMHADHRRGLHTSPVENCTQCFLEALDADAAAVAQSAGALHEPEPAPTE
jgi:hypothetical protein